MTLGKEFCNWRRYILVGTKKDIEKYLNEQPISEEHIVKRSSINNLNKNYKNNECPDCIRGITLQSTDIILINISKNVYNYFKEQVQPSIKIYPSCELNPRIYKVDV